VATHGASTGGLAAGAPPKPQPRTDFGRDTSTDTAPTYTLDDGTPLTAQYDEANDAFNLWLDKPRPSRRHETADGHLVHLDPYSREFLGLTVPFFESRWRRQAEIAFEAPHAKRRLLLSAERPAQHRSAQRD
jgi:hypothetical protein